MLNNNFAKYSNGINEFPTIPNTFCLTERERFVYDRLQDDLSRAVFTARKIYAERPEVRTGQIPDSLFAGLASKPKGFDSLIELLKIKKFIIYGAGFRGKKTASILRSFGVLSNCIGIWDNDTAKKGTNVMGITVTPPEFSVLDNHELYIVIALSERLAYFREVKEKFINSGIPENQILSGYDFVHLKIEYLDSEIIPKRLSEEEVLVDVGCLDFLNSEEFIKLAPGVKKIYAFEPDESYGGRGTDSIGIIERKSSRLQNVNVEIYNFALWSEDSDGIAVSDMNKGSFFENDDKRLFKTKALDSIIPGDERVTFIKADIEGAEMRMLIGAKNTLTRCKPILALKVYHRPYDYYEIGEYALKLVPEYKLYLRQESWGMHETVLYCVI